MWVSEFINVSVWGIAWGVVKTYTVHNLYTQPPQLIPKIDVKVPKLIPFLRSTTTILLAFQDDIT